MIIALIIFISTFSSSKLLFGKHFSEMCFISLLMWTKYEESPCGRSIDKHRKKILNQSVTSSPLPLLKDLIRLMLYISLRINNDTDTRY